MDGVADEDEAGFGHGRLLSGGEARCLDGAAERMGRAEGKGAVADQDVDRSKVEPRTSLDVHILDSSRELLSVLRRQLERTASLRRP